MTDPELIRKAQEGDLKAKEELTNLFMPVVNCIARTYNNIPYIDDLISNGCLGLLNAINSYNLKDSKASFDTYASKCIKNAILDGLRKDKQNNKIIALTDDSDVSIDPQESTQDAELANILYAKVCATLTTMEKQVFDLKLKELSYSEISEKLNISKKDVDNRVQAIRKKIDKIKNSIIGNI